MKQRKLLTQVFPFLLPMRVFQKKLFYYTKLKFDSKKYSDDLVNYQFENIVYQVKSKLVNDKTDYDIKYQYNKVHNLKLAVKTLNKLIIKPNESFSFWHCLKNMKKYGEQKKGLSIVRGKMVEVEGGGLCQLSNILFELFLHTPLVIDEQHSHDSLNLPPFDFEYTAGVDATINEGWLDLIVTNYSKNTYQLMFDFDEENIYASVLAKDEQLEKYQLYNDVNYFSKIEGKYYQIYTLNRKKYYKESLVYDERILANKTLIEYDYNLIPLRLRSDF